MILARYFIHVWIGVRPEEQQKKCKQATNQYHVDIAGRPPMKLFGLYDFRILPFWPEFRGTSRLPLFINIYFIKKQEIFRKQENQIYLFGRRQKVFPLRWSWTSWRWPPSVQWDRWTTSEKVAMATMALRRAGCGRLGRWTGRRRARSGSSCGGASLQALEKILDTLDTGEVCPGGKFTLIKSIIQDQHQPWYVSSCGSKDWSWLWNFFHRFHTCAASPQCGFVCECSEKNWSRILSCRSHRHMAWVKKIMQK